MLDVIYLKLFGHPEVTRNKETVLFSFAKINALLYYMAINKAISREEIAGLLWPNKTGSNAKKNLRNTIYQANKTLDCDYIISPNNQILTLNPDLNIQSDVESFMQRPAESLPLYEGEFLQGFGLKDSESYDFWLAKMRTYFEQKFVEECYKKIQQDMAQGATLEVEHNIQRLIAIDEYDERYYQLLMRYYQDQHRNGKVIETYQHLVNRLQQDLRISPSSDTRVIYEETIKEVNRQKFSYPSEGITFWGRSKEIGLIEAEVANYLQSEPFQSIILSGPMGTGKSALYDRVLNNQSSDRLVIRILCQQEDSAHAFQALNWLRKEILTMVRKYRKKQYQLNTILTDYHQLFKQGESHQNQHSLYLDYFMDLAELIGDEKLIIRIEDIQWMDAASLGLLKQVIMRQHLYPLLFLLSANFQNHPALVSFVSKCSDKAMLKEIPMTALSYHEMGQFLFHQIPDLELSRADLDLIYQRSQGQVFYLAEFAYMLKMNMKLDSFTDRMMKYCRIQLADISPMAQEILEIVAYFLEAAPQALLMTLTVSRPDNLASIIEELIKKSMLVEVTSPELGLKFYSNMLKEYLYQAQSLTKRKMMHERIANIISRRLELVKPKPFYYNQVIYHYEQAKNSLKSLEYQIAYLESALQFEHDLFPVFNEAYFDRDYFSMKQHQMTQDKFKQIRLKIKGMEESHKFDPLYQKLILRTLYLEGRYLIRYNRYEQGLQYIQSVITKAKDSRDNEYLLKGYRQMIYYSIQTENVEEMATYLQLAMDLAICDNDHEAIGILLRLEGLHALMMGEFLKAQTKLENSIATFAINPQLERKYAINIAAAYDYLAEMHRNGFDFDRAIHYQSLAVQYCEATGIDTSLVIFYVDLGMLYFANQAFDQAKHYFLLARNIYQEINSTWKKPQLEAYLALIALREEDEAQVEAYIVKAKKYLQNHPNPREIGIIHWAFALLKSHLPSMPKAGDLMNVLLDQSVEYYQSQALKYLSPYRDQFERRYLQQGIKSVE